VPSLPALGPWVPPAERDPSLESIYRVSLTVDLCEGYGRQLAAFIAQLSATIPAPRKNSPLLINNKIISFKIFIYHSQLGAPQK